ncbi:MAG TPA: hypothetical protein VFQ35_09455 [Polyangiaceae bacterium]|nr:hypothetical protein [Polyangiaceae bacterium]
MAESIETPQVPAPEPKDSAEVVRCLEAARELWELAQLREAVRWVQRGAEAAEQDGNDMRALTLARKGADLAAHANAVAEKKAEEDSVDVDIDTGEPVEAPPTVPNPAAVSQALQEAIAAVRASQPPPLPPNEITEKSAVATPIPGVTEKSTAATPVPAAAEKSATSTPVPATPEKRASLAPAAASAEKPATRVSEKPGARSFPSPSRPPVTADRPSARPAATTATASRPPVASVSPKPAVAHVNGVAPNSSVPLAELIASGKAERVTVKRSALDANVLVVRASQGNKAAHGVRHAVLVYVDEDAG